MGFYFTIKRRFHLFYQQFLFEEISLVIVIIRNAINHCGVILHERTKNIEFHFTKYKRVNVKNSTIYEFENLIGKVILHRLKHKLDMVKWRQT